MWTTFTIPASFHFIWFWTNNPFILYSIHNMSTHICIFVPHVRNKHMAFCLAHHHISLNIDVHSSTQSQTTIHRSIELPKAFSGIEKYQPTTQYTLPLDAKYESTNDNDGRAFCGVQWNRLQNTRRLHGNQPNVLCWDIIPCISSNEQQRSSRRRGHSS